MTEELDDFENLLGLFKEWVAVLVADPSAKDPGTLQCRQALQHHLPRATKRLAAILVSVGTAITVPAENDGLNLDTVINLLEVMHEISGSLQRLYGTLQQLGWSE
ncbi:hypothetical protein ACRYCC_13965 [Actinomadura scrupuli]|uniref:hypothetical protein n=1 Tax=Actinomadura scrupuli TaxID=559629 RepID=UPI003D953111